MLEQFKEWMELTVPPAKYAYARGAWEENAANANQWFCVIKGMGGPAQDVDDRRPRYRVLLIGPREGRQHMARLMQDIELLIQAANGAVAPCGAASVRAISEPVGPEFTTENRPWCSVDFQVIF